MMKKIGDAISKRFSEHTHGNKALYKADSGAIIVDNLGLSAGNPTSSPLILKKQNDLCSNSE